MSPIARSEPQRLQRFLHPRRGQQRERRRRRPLLTRRPEEREEGKEPTRESEWREIGHIGDKGRFIEEANRRRDEKRERAEETGKDLTRDKSPGAAQYLHVVISPESGERMSGEDFRKIAREWTHDAAGREYPHVGAVHRDSGSRGRGEGHDHLHLLIARDKFSREELGERKEASEEVVRDIERFRNLERDRGLERDGEPYRDAQRERGEECDRGREERGGEREQGRAQEREIER